MSSEKEVTMTTQTEVQGLGEFVARFSHLGATPQSLQEECARHLENH